MSLLRATLHHQRGDAATTRAHIDDDLLPRRQARELGSDVVEDKLLLAVPVRVREADLLVTAEGRVWGPSPKRLVGDVLELVKSMRDPVIRLPGHAEPVLTDLPPREPAYYPLTRWTSRSWTSTPPTASSSSQSSSAAKRVLGSSRFILGPEVERSSSSASPTYVGAKHCVGVGNGLDALMLSLAALGIGPGDEVIVPAATFVATWLAVSRLGATPVPAAVADATLTLDPLAFEAAVSARTRAVVPVHLYGHPADLDAIGNIARDHGVHVVDDAAQAHGARYRGRPIGALASATAFSFYPTKNLGAVGDGGAVTTNDRSIADRVRMLGNYGARQKHVSESLGWNSRLDPIQAAILQVKLDKLDEWNSRRRRVAARYHEGLSGLGWVRLPSEASWATHVYHLFVVRVSDREGFARHLAANSIATAIHYPVPPYRQPAYRNLTFRSRSGTSTSRTRSYSACPWAHTSRMRRSITSSTPFRALVLRPGHGLRVANFVGQTSRAPVFRRTRRVGLIGASRCRHEASCPIGSQGRPHTVAGYNRNTGRLRHLQSAGNYRAGLRSDRRGAASSLARRRGWSSARPTR